jgi:hypothetical protein
MFIHFEPDGECDGCGDPCTVVRILMHRSHDCINLCIACLRALDQALSYASVKLKIVTVPQSSTAHEMTSAAIETKRERGKVFFLDLIKKRSQQMRQMGFLGPLTVESLARTDSQLEALDLNTLKVIARAAGRFVRVAKRRF